MPRKLLYWLDQGTKTISRVNLEGHHRKTVVESNGYLDRPFGLAVFEVEASSVSSAFCLKTNDDNDKSCPSPNISSASLRVLCTGVMR